MNGNNPNFSICIPNYNYGKYIGDTLKSVLSQTYQNFEVIVVDNASTDDSLEVVKSFKDDRIKLFINKYNVGFATNLHKTTSYAKNDFINLLSSDDQMKPTALETYANIIKELWDYREKLFIVSDVEEFDDDGNIARLTTKASDSFARVPYTIDNKSGEFRKKYETFPATEALQDGLARLSNIGAFCSTIYSRSLWQSIEGYSGIRSITPDTHFALKALTQDPLVVHINKPLFRYRIQTSDNRASLTKNIRVQIDQYLDTLEFGTKEILSIIDMKEASIQKMFIVKNCLDKTLSNIALGNYTLAFKIFSFAFATYPSKTFSNYRTYIIFGLLLLGPLSKFLASPLKTIYSMSKNGTKIKKFKND